MNKKYDDPVFGTMEYKHSWVKEEPDSITFFKKQFPVRTVAQAYSGDAVLPIPQAKYSEAKGALPSLLERQADALLSYCCQFPESAPDLKKEDLPSLLVPRTLLFQKDGSWGILFDYEKDPENGLALFCENGEWQVGPQDAFL